MAEINYINGYEIADAKAREDASEALQTANANTAEINNVKSEVSGLASGSPKGVYATVSALETDNPDTGVYIVSADGHIYSWTKDGSSAIDLGVYQATKIADESISKNMLNQNLKNAIYKFCGTNIEKGNDLSRFIRNSSNSTFVASTASTSLIVPIQPSTKYIVQKGVSSRFALYLSPNYPVAGGSISNYVENNSVLELEITSGSNDNYLTILFHNSNAESRTVESVLETIKIYNTIVQDELTQADYLDNKIDTVFLDDKNVNLLSYRPLGVLQKGYIALSCDDGKHSLATTTIPILKEYKTTYNKNIPVTFGLMTNSEVFTDNTEKALVQEMISDYGCSVAIHGTNPYTNYTEDALYNFLDTQKTNLTTLCNFSPTSIIYPDHEYTVKSSIIAGSYFGVCTTGGLKTPIKYENGVGNCNCAGPRSNMYTLYRDGLFNGSNTKQRIKAAIDYAYDNHLIYMPFWHDNTLASDYTRNKELLDYCVDYANSKGLEFINIGDIPNII